MFNRFIYVILSFLMLLLFFPVTASAQIVTNVDATQEGKAIAITYYLQETARISVFVSYDGGKTKSPLPNEYVSGDVGKHVDPGEQKKILWHVLDQYPDQDFQGDNISFIVSGKPCMQFFIMANGGYSLDSVPLAGITVGQLGSLGWYMKGISSFSLPKSTQFECDETGAVDGVYPAYSGRGSKFKAYGVAGMNFRLAASIYLYAGAGYGMSSFDWETVDEKWVRYKPESSDGFALDAGVMARINKVTVSAGAMYVGGAITINAGFGWVF